MHRLTKIHHHIKRPRNFLYLIIGASVFLLLLGLMGGIVFNSLQKSQDIRQRASTNAQNQRVEVTTVLPDGGQNLLVNQANNIMVRVNTNSENTVGLQLGFCLQAPPNTQVSVTNVNPTLLNGTPMVKTDNASCNGWYIFFIGANGSGFNTNINAVDALKIEVTPSQTGTLSLTFNDDVSKSLIYGLVDIDSLKPIAPQSFNCGDPQNPTNTPIPTLTTAPTATKTPTPTQTPTKTPTPTTPPNCNCTSWTLVNPANPGNNTCSSGSTKPVYCQRSCNAGCTLATQACLSYQDCGLPNPTSTPTRAVTPRPSASATPTSAVRMTSTPTPRRSPTPTPTGTKNWTEISENCNKSCTSNSNCPNNMRCYDSKCRLADNPSSTVCGMPADQGIARSCNQYCADSRECGNGLICWYNQCRAPEAVDHTDCSLPSGVIARSMQLNCNKACTSNRDCSVNMRCYNGSCRSASNPTSNSCSPLARRVASAPAGTTSTKGGVGLNVSPTAAEDITARYGADITAAPTQKAAAGLANGGLEPIVTTPPLDSATPPVYNPPAWSNPDLPITERLSALLGSNQAILPIAVLVLGFILLVFALLVGRRKKTAVPPVKIVERNVPPASPGQPMNP